MAAHGAVSSLAVVLLLFLCCDGALQDVQGAAQVGGAAIPNPLTPADALRASVVALAVTSVDTGNATAPVGAAAKKLKQSYLYTLYVWVVAGALDVVGFLLIFKVKAPNPTAFNAVFLVSHVLWVVGFSLFIDFIIQLRNLYYPTGDLDVTLLVPTLLRLTGGFFLTIQPWTALASGDGKGLMFANLVGAGLLHMANMASTVFMTISPLYGPSSKSTWGMYALLVGTFFLVGLNYGSWKELYPSAHPPPVFKHAACTDAAADDDEACAGALAKLGIMRKAHDGGKFECEATWASSGGKCKFHPGEDGKGPKPLLGPDMMAIGGSVLLTVGSALFLPDAFAMPG